MSSKENNLNGKSFVRSLQDKGVVIALVALVIALSIASPEFRTFDNFLSLLRQSAINGLIAFGMTCVILTGGIDLSVGSGLALTAAIAAFLIKGGMAVAKRQVRAAVREMLKGQGGQ